MDYKCLDRILSENLESPVVIFGAGAVGRKDAFDFVKRIGLKIANYVDNYAPAGKEVRDGITIISPNALYQMKNVIVFIGLMDYLADDIERQLLENGISNIIKLDQKTLSDIYLSIEADRDILLGSKYEKYLLLLNDENYLVDKYLSETGSCIDINKPVLFNEKLQYLKIHFRKPIQTTMVDKYEVKKLVADLVGEEYVIPTLGVWKSFDEIDFKMLPKQFVLKCTHDSGSTIVVKDKDNANYADIKKKLEYALSINYYWGGSREWPYKGVIPRILAEPLLVDESGVELKDYKIFAFNGTPRMIQVDYDRFNNHRRNIYDVNWKYMNMTIKFPTDANHIVEKPKPLKKMLGMTEKLSAGFPHIRVDYYVIGERIYFGEFTFYHGGGYEMFTPESWNKTFGDWIDIRELTTNDK